MPNALNPTLIKKIPTECVSWRWNGNLGDDMIYAAQEAMFGHALQFGQYEFTPEAVFIGGGTFIAKGLQHPDLLKYSQRMPVTIFGTGVADPLFWGRKDIPIWMEIVKNAQFVGVRGPLSLECLLEWGASEHHVQWTGDSALYFAEQIKPKISSTGHVAVNLGTTYNKLFGFNEPAVEKVIIEVIKQLIKENHTVTMVSVWPPDDVVIERIKEQMPMVDVEYWYDDYAKALNSINKFDFIICEKLHMGIVAACRAVPFIALNYRSKVLDFCRSIKWEKFCISTENLRSEPILEFMSEFKKSQKEYSQLLNSNVLEIKNRLQEPIPKVISALGGRC